MVLCLSPQLLARAMQSAFECLDRDAKPLGGFWRREPFDIARENDVAMVGRELRQRARQDATCLEGRYLILSRSRRIVKLRQDVGEVCVVMPVRTKDPVAAIANDGEEPRG